MEIIAITSSLLANVLTSLIKPAKWKYDGPHRAIYIRALNAFIGIVSMLAMYFFFGGSLDQGELTSAVDLVVTAALTFGASQGWFKLAEKTIK